MNVEEFKQKPLRVHSFLTGVPMHSLDFVELPGGRAAMNIAEISDAIGFGGVKIVVRDRQLKRSWPIACICMEG